MRVIVIELLIHLCWFQIVFANNQESERQVMEGTGTESIWEEKAIEVLEQILSSKVITPPSSPKKPFYHYGRQNAEVKQKVWSLKDHINGVRYHAQNLLSNIKKRNATASKSLWETSAKSASEARQLAEEAASFTKDVLDNISEEMKMKAVAEIASHIEGQIGPNNRSISQFYNSQKTTDAFLVKASKDSLAQLTNLTSELDSFRLMAKGKVDAVREAAEADVNKTVAYLHLAESLQMESFSKKWTSLDEVAAFAKEEAVRCARQASQKSLNVVQNKFDSFKGVNNEKAKHFEYSIEDATKETKSAHKEIIENWTRTNNDAIAISRTFFNFTEVQTVLGRAKSAINRTKVDIENAKHSSKWGAIEWDLVKMSDSVEKVVNTGSDLGSFQTFQIDMGQSMHGVWAMLYGLQAKERVSRLKDFLSKINQTNPIDLREAVIKLDDAKKDSQYIAEISLAAVEEATSEMRKSVDLVQGVFHVTEVKAEGIKEEYRQHCFVAFRKAKAVVTETNLATARALDEIKRTTDNNFNETMKLVHHAESCRKLGYCFIVLLVILAVPVVAILVHCLFTECSPCVALFSWCRSFKMSHHVSLADIKTEDDLLKLSDIKTEEDLLTLSERKMREVLEICGVEISEDANQEKLLELLRQLWLHGERNPLMNNNFVGDDEETSKCKVCMDADIDCVILDCGHLVTCNKCGKKLTECPICRQKVLQVLSVAPVTKQEMMRLTTWQVKRLLSMCGIGFKDRVLARRKMEEGAIQEKEHKCKVCMERVIDCVFLNCGHLMVCTCCGQKIVSSSDYTVDSIMKKCPICQKLISRVAKIYRT